MFTWLKRAALYVWKVLDAMADRASPTEAAFEYYNRRIARLETRVAQLEVAGLIGDQNAGSGSL